MSRNNPIFVHLLVLILAGMVLLAFVGCKTLPAAPIPAPSHNRDSVRIEYRHDSIYTDRWHTIYTKGDTVFVHDSVWRDRWHRTHDTIRIQNTDTIYQPVPVEVIKEVDKSPFLRNSGIALWVILAILFLSIIAGIIIKFAK